jgi:hypothetical protein
MKNLILSLSFMTASFVAFSQTTTQSKTLVKGTVEGWEIIQKITNSVDTTTYFYYGFRNMKYTQLKDYASILYSKKADLDTFAVKLKELANMETKINMTVSIGRSVTLSIVDFTDSIYIESLGDGYTMITRKNAIKLAEELLVNSSYLK